MSNIVIREATARRLINRLTKLSQTKRWALGQSIDLPFMHLDLAYKVESRYWVSEIVRFLYVCPLFNVRSNCSTVRQPVGQISTDKEMEFCQGLSYRLAVLVMCTTIE